MLIGNKSDSNSLTRDTDAHADADGADICTEPFKSHKGSFLYAQYRFSVQGCRPGLCYRSLHSDWLVWERV